MRCHRGHPAERLEAGAIGRRHPAVGVEVEAVALGLARAAGGDVTEVRLVAKAADAGAGPGAEGGTAWTEASDGAKADARGGATARSRLPARLDRQLASRAKRDGVDTVLPEPGRDRLAVQGPDPTPPGLLGIVGQLPEARPELALERRRRPLRGVALRHLPLAVQHVSLRRPAAVGEDPTEEQQRLALERVASSHEVVLELDDERVDVDLVAVEQELPGLADGVTLGVELGEPDARPDLAPGLGPLVQ